MKYKKAPSLLGTMFNTFVESSDRIGSIRDEVMFNAKQIASYISTLQQIMAACGVMLTEIKHLKQEVEDLKLFNSTMQSQTKAQSLDTDLPLFSKRKASNEEAN